MTKLLPMLATPGTPGQVDGPDWVHEFKWDGVRALVAIEAGRVQVRSRNGNDVTATYPELSALSDLVPAGTVLDGEVVAFDDDHVPSFPLLQHRMHVQDGRRALALAAEVPATFVAFDVLCLGGTWLVGEPWSVRRERLVSLGLDGPAWITPPVGDDATAMLEVARQRRLEGVVSKRRSSPYRLGERSPDWRKMRLVHETEVVVGGWRRGTGHRSGSFGSLLVGRFDVSGGLRFAGGLGSGFSDHETERLQGVLVPLVRDTSPFVDAPDDPAHVWVEPEIVVVARFREWTPDGKLRQPSYRGQRTDVEARTVASTDD